jgi:hypothetical protein
MAFRRGKIQPAGKMLLYAAGLVGARPMAGQLTLDQSIEVRILCPQPIYGVQRHITARYGGKESPLKERVLFFTATLQLPDSDIPHGISMVSDKIYILRFPNFLSFAPISIDFRSLFIFSATSSGIEGNTCE